MFTVHRRFHNVLLRAFKQSHCHLTSTEKEESAGRKTVEFASGSVPCTQSAFTAVGGFTLSLLISAVLRNEPQAFKYDASSPYSVFSTTQSFIYIVAYQNITPNLNLNLIL